MHEGDDAPFTWGMALQHAVQLPHVLSPGAGSLRSQSARTSDRRQFGLTTLHNIVARGGMAPEERVAFATAILDRGARLDIRDHLLMSTPLGWACRWGRVELVKLYLARGVDPVEADAEPWATPLAWARKKGDTEIEGELRRAGAG